MSFIRNHYFSNTYTTSVHMTITSQNARARRALQPRDFSVETLVFDIASVIYRTKIVCKEGLVVSFKMPKPILKLRKQFLGRLSAHFHRLRYIDVITYIYRSLAHLSRRLIGELLVYKGIRRPSVVRPSSVVRRPSSINIFKRHLL